MQMTLSNPGDSELLIRKSRFIGRVCAVADRAAAQSVVAGLWQQHPGASHVCWALLAGGHSAAVDDGEPGGTAGRPMLDVLRHQQLDGVLATVVRYYGGIKLGTGGLVRAYTDCVAQALLAAQKSPLERLCILHCSVPYACEGTVRRGIEAAGAQLLGVQHEAEVIMTLRIVASGQTAFVAQMRDATQGRFSCEEDAGI
jgi:uncharacterized YigZ family protein